MSPHHVLSISFQSVLTPRQHRNLPRLALPLNVTFARLTGDSQTGAERRKATGSLLRYVMSFLVFLLFLLPPTSQESQQNASSKASTLSSSHLVLSSDMSTSFFSVCADFARDACLIT
eukprot:1151837-Rhodomonas_salina.1